MAVDSALQEAVEARTGQTVDQAWLDEYSAEVMAYVRLLAPCKRSTWIDYSDLPADVRTVVAAALARLVDNPRGIKQETIGEYSYTLSSGAGAASTGPFTGAEARIITANSGCGGSVRSVPMTPPALLPLEVPEVNVFEQEEWS